MFKKGQIANPKGRPKGSPNRNTLEIKQAFHAAFFERGGVQALIKWAAENETEFYKLSARLIPVEVNGSIEVREAEDMTDAELARIAASGSARAATKAGGSQSLN